MYYIIFPILALFLCVGTREKKKKLKEKKFNTDVEREEYIYVEIEEV